MAWTDKLSENLEIYYEVTGITVSPLNEKDETVTAFGSECSYCTLFREASGARCPCDPAHLNACR